MNIGSAWTKTEEKDSKNIVTGISVTLDDAILALYPQLKGVKFGLKPIPKEQRTKEKSPHWRVIVFKPQEQTSAQGEASEMIGEEEIPY